MRISKKAKPELCCKRGVTDEACFPRLVLREKEQGFVTASNGAVTVKLPCDVDAGDREGIITHDALRAARMHASKEENADGKMTLICADPIEVPDAKQTHERPDLQGELFKEELRIPGRGRKGQKKLSFDVFQLLKIAKAMAVRRVTLYYVDGKDDIRVEPEDEAPVWGAEAVMLANSKSEPVEDEEGDEGGEAA